MTDVLTKEQRHKNMQHIRAKDTKIEFLLRKAPGSITFRYNQLLVIWNVHSPHQRPAGFLTYKSYARTPSRSPSGCVFTPAGHICLQ